MEDLLQILLNALSVGAVYALFALGYTLVFSVLGVINFAHGAIFTLGAYFTYLLIGGGVGSNGLLAGFQSLWPLFVVLVIVRSRRRVGSHRHRGTPEARTAGW